MHTQTAIIDWLSDAYAMEKALETALKKLTDHPHTHQALREQAALHCTKTRHHSQTLAECLKRHGSDPSSLKTVLTQGMELIRGGTFAFGRDERIKDVLAVLVTELFEIASLTILRTGAAQLGQQDIVAICDDILLEEKRMTLWLQINLPQIIAAYLAAATKEEVAQNSAVTADGATELGTHWEFIQLGAHTASLYGASHPHTFVSLLN